LKRDEDKVFWDLGCGTGKALIVASLCGFSEICGVELLETLCKVAKEIIEKYIKTNKGQLFKVICNNILKEDWVNADIVYISSICFSDELMNDIIEKARGLRKGARVISLTQWEAKDFEVIYKKTLKMTWGKAQVFIMEKH